jgi:hypothetical protein
MRFTLAILFLFFFLMSISSVTAQDLIITLEGDSINCRITKIKQNHIFFTYISDSKPVNTLLSMQKISYYEPDFYEESIELADVKSYLKRPSLIFDINGGYSYRIARIDPSVDAFTRDYFEGLKSGLFYGADLTYYFSETLGAGIKFSSSLYNNSVSNVTVTFNNGIIKYGEVSDDIMITFIGPTIITRYYPGNNDNCMTMGASFGYMTYIDDGLVVDPIRITGNTLGMGLDFGYDFSIGPSTSIGLRLSFLSGVLPEVEIEEDGETRIMRFEEGSYESLQHLDFGIVLTYSIL